MDKNFNIKICFCLSFLLLFCSPSFPFFLLSFFPLLSFFLLLLFSSPFLSFSPPSLPIARLICSYRVITFSFSFFPRYPFPLPRSFPLSKVVFVCFLQILQIPLLELHQESTFYRLFRFPKDLNLILKYLM